MANAFTSWFNLNIMPSIKGGYLHKGKRYDAVFAFWKKMGEFEEELAALPAVTIWAPPLGTLGFTSSHQIQGTVIYLSPLLEMEKMPFVVHTVAHEFAHVALGHHVEGALTNEDFALNHAQRPHEIAANALALKWGFPPKDKDKLAFFHRMAIRYLEGKGGRSHKQILTQLGELE